MAYEFKQLSAVESAKAISETTNVLIEDSGVIKKVSGSIVKPFGENDDGTVQKISGKYVEGMGWSEGVNENIFNGAEPAYDSGDERFNLGSPRINSNKSYDIIIRGDVYKNVAPVKFNSYYPMICWGICASYEIAADAEYPFQICAGWLDATDNDGNLIWDTNGDFVGKPGNVVDWMYPHIRVSPEKYPNLKPEDVQIIEPEIVHPIDPKLLPSVTATINVTQEDGNYTDMSLRGADFNTILSALKNGQRVIINCKYTGDSGVCIAAPVYYSSEYILVCDYFHGAHYVILPDNTVLYD